MPRDEAEGGLTGWPSCTGNSAGRGRSEDGYKMVKWTCFIVILVLGLFMHVL